MRVPKRFNPPICVQRPFSTVFRSLGESSDEWGGKSFLYAVHIVFSFFLDHNHFPDVTSSSSMPTAITRFRGPPPDRTRSFEVAAPKEELGIRVKSYLWFGLDEPVICTVVTTLFKELLRMRRDSTRSISTAAVLGSIGALCPQQEDACSLRCPRKETEVGDSCVMSLEVLGEVHNTGHFTI